MTMNFSHSGKCGDILLSLPFVKACLLKTGQIGSTLHLHTNVPHMFRGPNEPDSVMLTQKAAEFIQPLLDAQSWIKTTISDSIPDGYFDLSNFRKLMKNFGSGNIPYWYLTCINEHIDIDCSIPSLDCKASTELKDKIIVCFTERYNPYKLDMNCLRDFREKLVFIGLPREHAQFEKKFFRIDYKPVENALDIAKLMKGSKGVVANLGGNYSIAESIKCKRICLWADIMQYGGRLVVGPCNVSPQGGWWDIALNSTKLRKLVEELLCQN